MKTDPEFKARFFQGILLPDKLNAEYLNQKDPTGVDEVMQNFTQRLAQYKQDSKESKSQAPQKRRAFVQNSLAFGRQGNIKEK